MSLSNGASVVMNTGTLGGRSLLGGGADVFNGAGGTQGSVYGGAGVDKILGGLGDAALFGDAGADVLRGGQGDDDLFGGADADQVFGALATTHCQAGQGRTSCAGVRAMIG